MAPSEGESAHSADTTTQSNSRDDVTAAVEELLNQLSTKFTAISSEIFSRMDDMSKRVDSLEAALLESKGQDSSSTKS